MHLKIPFPTRRVPGHRQLESLTAMLILIGALLVVGCETAPTAPDALSAAELSDAVSTSADQAVHSKATKNRQDFQQTIPAPGIPAPSPCLGGTFFINGTISGWSQSVLDPNGTLHFTEHIDFSQLVASFGDRTWTAQPGSHEIWSGKFSVVGDPEEVVVHEGRTRFLADDGQGPKMMFIHRIHRRVLPGGELQHHNTSMEAVCIGEGA
jgi:hypothetical protein